MAVNIHPTALVEPGAELDDGVTIGPYCVVGPHVRLHGDVTLRAHVVIEGRTTIGAGTTVYPFTSLGLPPQDMKFGGEPSELVIGEGNVIREHVTMNPGTRGGGMVTRIGNHGMFMVACHVAHDCQVGDHVILANNATLAGHVVVGDYARLGGLVAVHQFVRIGEHAMIGGMTGVEQDVIPFGMVVGERGHLVGLNLVGLKRRGFDRDAIAALRLAFRQLFEGTGELAGRLEAVDRTLGEVVPVRQLIDFIRADSERKILKPKLAGSG